MEVQFHKDGILPWNGHAMRTHQPEYMLMLYYPQDTPEDLGPTEILPCTQYFHNDSTPENGYPLAGRTIGGGVSSEPDFARRDANRAAVLKQVGWPAETTPKKVIVPKGSVAFTHFDVYHRGTRRNPELPDDAQTRLMVSNHAPSYNLQRMPGTSVQYTSLRHVVHRWSRSSSGSSARKTTLLRPGTTDLQPCGKNAPFCAIFT
eukprot:COSAG06_NODE_325_length_17475_cov_13.436982_7_plen_204_part_00